MDIKKIIFIFPETNEWKMKCEHCTGTVSYNTQSEAINIAKQHVGSYPEGTISQILIEGPGKQIIIEWTCGVDLYPPR